MFRLPDFCCKTPDSSLTSSEQSLRGILRSCLLGLSPQKIHWIKHNTQLFRLSFFFPSGQPCELGTTHIPILLTSVERLNNLPEVSWQIQSLDQAVWLYKLLTVALYFRSRKLTPWNWRKVALGHGWIQGLTSAEQKQTVSMAESPTTQQKEHLCLPRVLTKVLELSLVGLGWVTCLSLDPVTGKIKLMNSLARPDLCAYSRGWGSGRVTPTHATRLWCLRWFPEGCFQESTCQRKRGEDVMGNIFMTRDTPAELFCFIFGLAVYYVFSEAFCYVSQ